MARLYVKIKEQDNVAVAVEELKAGTEIMEGLTVNQDIPQAHKIALCDIPAGGKMIRYGVVLGYALHDIKRGDWINEHMLKLPESPSLDHMEYGSNLVKMEDLPCALQNNLDGLQERRGTGRNQKSAGNRDDRTVCRRGTEGGCGAD